MNTYIRIHPTDNVAVALQPMTAGTHVELTEPDIQVELQDDVPAGHKFLLHDIDAGADVVKYGYPIGHVREAHRAGSWIDDRHIVTNLSGLLDYSYQRVFTPAQLSAGADARLDFSLGELPATFRGYRRANGDVGIRNEIFVVPTVGCVNGIARQLAEEVPNAVALTHNYGCSQLGDDHENTRRILRDIVLHPNAGAVLIVGLGCENNQPEEFRKLLGDYDPQRIRLLTTQEVEGDELEVGRGIMQELHALTSADERVDVPVSELRIGLKCGGSDGLSGITANPLLGVFSDWLVGQGGTTVLTEVPEMFGAETILMNRCASPQLFEKTVGLINDFKNYYLSHGEPVGENPSPGNKAGGISTLEDKALGCTQKCGRSAVRGVLAYGERLTERGLNLLSAPGNDLVASTALGASGCHIVLFTTGRGTPFGSFVPTLKVSTNTTLANRHPSWIDFNAGTLAEGATMQQTARDFVLHVLAVANGELTWNERKHYQEISIFKNGVTL